MNMARKSVTRSAYIWKAFFDLLSKCKRPSDTEQYVSTFSTAFKLAKAEYRLGDRVVML